MTEEERDSRLRLIYSHATENMRELMEGPVVPLSTFKALKEQTRQCHVLSEKWKVPLKIEVKDEERS